MQGEAYRLTCQRYIELNPVRAGMVTLRNTGGAVTARMRSGSETPSLRHIRILMALGEGEKARQAAYRELFSGVPDRASLDEIRLALSRSQPLGNARFIAMIEAVTGIRREAKPRGRPRAVARESAHERT